MNHQKLKHNRQQRRRFHVRNKLLGTADRPRLSVFRSSKNIYAQLIDDVTGHTLAAVSTLRANFAKEIPYGGNIFAAKRLGLQLAVVALEKGICFASFDRGHYRYHGRIRALADGAREGGLNF